MGFGTGIVLTQKPMLFTLLTCFPVPVTQRYLLPKENVDLDGDSMVE